MNHHLADPEIGIAHFVDAVRQPIQVVATAAGTIAQLVVTAARQIDERPRRSPGGTGSSSVVAASRFFGTSGSARYVHSTASRSAGRASVWIRSSRSIEVDLERTAREFREHKQAIAVGNRGIEWFDAGLGIDIHADARHRPALRVADVAGHRAKFQDWRFPFLFGHSQERLTRPDLGLHHCVHFFRLGFCYLMVVRVGLLGSVEFRPLPRPVRPAGCGLRNPVAGCEGRRAGGHQSHRLDFTLVG